jgi:hypothetical protein
VKERSVEGLKINPLNYLLMYKRQEKFDEGREGEGQLIFPEFRVGFEVV